MKIDDSENELILKRDKLEHGDLVRIGKNFPDFCSHFPQDKLAIIEYSYFEKYGGKEPEQSENEYFIYIENKGGVGWYRYSQLELIEKNRSDLLKEWKIKEAEKKEFFFDLDRIFKNGKERFSNPDSYMIQSLWDSKNKNNELGHLWGNQGEGFRAYLNGLFILELAKNFLLSGDKEGWLNFEIKRVRKVE